MSIHLQDIETLLASYVKAHSTGSIKVSGSIIPDLFRALVALVEEKTGGEPVPSTLNRPAPAPVVERLPAPIIDAAYNPLGIMEDYFISQGVRPNHGVDVVEETFQAAQQQIADTAFHEPSQAPQEPVEQAPEPVATETAPEAPVAPEPVSGDEPGANGEPKADEPVTDTADEPKKAAPKKPAAKKA